MPSLKTLYKEKALLFNAQYVRLVRLKGENRLKPIIYQTLVNLFKALRTQTWSGGGGELGQ